MILNATVKVKFATV